MKIFQTYIPGNRKVNPALFWDYDTSAFDPKTTPRLTVTRIIMLGGKEDWYAGFDIFGGIEQFAKIAKEQVTGLDEKDLQFMCNALNIKKEETQCYIRQQLRQKQLNS